MRSPHHIRLLFAITAIAIGGGGAASADDLYKCTNASGFVLYTNEAANRAGCTLLKSTPEAPTAGKAPPPKEPAASREHARTEPIAGPECAGPQCSIKISKSKDGHFYIDGAVNGTKVRFLVDTGASVVVLNQSTASEADVRGSKNVRLRTAGGTVSGSVAYNVPISIANLPTVNSEVAINPSLEGSTSLLGQSYLKMFKVTNQGSTMELSP